MEIIERLRAERQALVARMGEIDKMLRQYEELDRIAQTLLSPSSQSAEIADSRKPKIEGDVNVPITEYVQPNGTRRKKTPIAEFEKAVTDVLRDADAPMDRAELYDALTARGIVIGDGNRDRELNALSARVYRMAQDGRLESQRGQGYRLKAVGEQSHTDVKLTDSGEQSSGGELDEQWRRT